MPDLGDPLDDKLYKYLVKIQQRTLDVIKDKHQEYIQGMADIKTNKYKEIPEPEYGPFIKLAEMLEKLGIHDFKDFTSKTEKQHN